MKECIPHEIHSQSKVCLVIIDSGNFENVVSIEMVQKLNLKIVPHPTLCKFYWLQKRSEIKVKMRCLEEFSIGKYKDMFGAIWHQWMHAIFC